MTPQNKDVAMTPNQRALEALHDAFAEKDNEKSWQYVAIAIGEHLNTIRAALLSEVQAWQDIKDAPTGDAKECSAHVAKQAFEMTKRLWLKQTDENIKLQAEIANLREQLRTARVFAATGWMPIETAPRDGKTVLFYCDGDTRKGYADLYYFYIINNGDYHDGGYGRDYRCDPENKGRDYGYDMPTHWQPLPAPPKDGE